MVSIRILRPSNNWSDKKSIDQQSSGASAGQRSSCNFALILCFGGLVPQLQPKFPVESPGPFVVDLPFISLQHLLIKTQVTGKG